MDLKHGCEKLFNARKIRHPAASFQTGLKIVAAEAAAKRFV